MGDLIGSWQGVVPARSIPQDLLGVLRRFSRCGRERGSVDNVLAVRVPRGDGFTLSGADYPFSVPDLSYSCIEHMFD